ncbi:Sphingomyelin phosphodiesterase [Halotydeus destructor]|nr:Sphingomyelin phosphodiesterase [Halotydeus destructor]
MGHNGSRKSHTSRRDVTLMAAAASDSFSPVNQLSTASLLSLTGLELFSNVLIAPGLSGSLTKLSLAHSSIAKDDLDYIGRHSKLSPEEMCSILLSVDCGHRVTDKTDWTVFIPAKLPTDWGHGYAQPTGDRLAAGLSDGRDRQGDTIEFVQVTDMHVDTQYEHGSNANCDEPVCCRSSSSSSSSGSSSLSHFAADTADIAGLWGDYRKCDSPLRTVVSALDQIVKSHPEAQYWIWTGDIGPHDHFSTKEEIISHVRLVTQLVKQYAKVPVIPVIGNHETSPANSGGYYTMPLRPRLRAVIMNSNYCARLNPWTLYDSVDPGNQLDWLVKVLAEAEQAHERVHIVGHIAPDPTECTRPWLRNFLNILERFQDTIVGQFYGHTHRDEFRVYTSAHGMPIGMGLIGPSLTSYKGNNPAYRTYQINHSGHIRDHHTYYFNLTEANLSLIPTWRKMYTFSSAYGLPTVAHDNLNYLVHLMRMDDELFAMFYRYYSREANMAATGLTPCNDLCKANILDELIVDERQKPRKISKKYYGES